MSKRSAIGPVQVAVYQHLHGDTTLMALLPIYDEVPEGTSYPYAQIVDLVETLDNTQGKQGRSVLVTISAWSQKPGFLFLESVLEELMRLLDEGPIADPTPSTGWSIWNNVCERNETIHMADGLTRQLTVQARVDVEQTDG